MPEALDKENEREAHRYATREVGPKPEQDEATAGLFVGVATAMVPAVTLSLAGFSIDDMQWALIAAGVVTGIGTYAHLSHRSNAWWDAYARRLIELDKRRQAD